MFGDTRQYLDYSLFLSNQRHRHKYRIPECWNSYHLHMEMLSTRLHLFRRLFPSSPLGRYTGRSHQHSDKFLRWHMVLMLCIHLYLGYNLDRSILHHRYSCRKPLCLYRFHEHTGYWNSGLCLCYTKVLAIPGYTYTGRNLQCLNRRHCYTVTSDTRRYLSHNWFLSSLRHKYICKNPECRYTVRGHRGIANIH